MQFLKLAIVLATCSSAAFAQLPDEEYRGTAKTGLLLRKLATTKSVLVIGAHPDDEDNQLLSYLSLHDGAAVSYLSLTRGEGGQNSIGSELGPALGVLRTGELLAARSADQSMQYFTRAYDFGFSKTAEETFQHWPRDSVLADVVRIIRRVRPDIIVTIFSGTPRDGHGHHQVSGILAREAFAAAADPNRFPEQIRAGLRAHRALQLVQATGYRQADPTQRFATGTVDPLFGRSYAQIAAIGRSRHRSQDMGQVQTIGPRFTSVRVLKSMRDADSLLFSGYVTQPGAMAREDHEAAPVQSALADYDSAVAAAQASLTAYTTQRVAHVLAPVRSEVAGVMSRIRNPDLKKRMEEKLVLLDKTMLQAAGVVVDAVADREMIIPGSTFNLDVTIWNAGKDSLRILGIEPVIPNGWSASGDTGGGSVDNDSVLTRRFSIRVPPDASISQPYFLARPHTGDTYAWPSSSAVAGDAFDAEPVRAAVQLLTGSARVADTVPATHRVVDRRQGEVRRAVHVAPAFAIRPEPSTSVMTLASVSSGSAKGLAVTAEITSNGAAATLTVQPQLPPGWRAVPAQVNLPVASRVIANARFIVNAPRKVAPGRFEIGFVAYDSAGRRFDLSQRIVDYPHIRNQVLFEPAVQHVHVLDVRLTRGLRVGYVVGMDAAVPELLEQLGIVVERLDEGALAKADLGRYDAIVIGSRAYEVRPDLIAHNARVLDYARRGGNVIVQYQQYEFVRGGFAPFSLTLARPHDRITDENSPVGFIDPSSPVLTHPNRITQQDFTGWVQERALYMPNTWSPEFKEVLEMADPGEAPRRGAILTARLGKGTYTYTGISFFRQIPAGVPGALRLFVNLLSLGARDDAF